MSRITPSAAPMRRSPGTAWGKAPLGPPATMGGNDTASAPRSRMPFSICQATSFSVRPGTRVSQTSAVFVPELRAGDRLSRAEFELQREADRAVEVAEDQVKGPIIIRDLPGASNDTVIWKSNAAFIVDVEVDDGYKKDTGAPNPPRSPFVNTVTGQDFSVMPQAAQAVGGVFVVTGKVTKGTQAPDHMFYKMTIWSQGLKLDPDFFCDR